jgi:Kef-type K+ transport system membrane component KefB
LAILAVASVDTAILLTYVGVLNLLKPDEKMSVKDVCRAARQISVILSGRGAVGIIIVSVALIYRLINNQAYSLVIVATTVISIIAPMLLSRQMKRQVLILKE